MNKTNKKRWVKALRSGEYTQAENQLCLVDSDRSESFCCLGVAYDVLYDGDWELDGNSYGIRFDSDGESSIEWRTLPQVILDKIGLTHEDEAKLAEMNDEGMTFEQIADYIEKRKTI